MSGFTKLHNSILLSTIWQASKEVKILWVTMLALADRNGEIHASIPGLAHASVLSIAECEEGLKLLLGPDAHSRTPDNDGRRLEVIPGGWLILNYAKYRKLQSVEDVREKNAERQRRHREKTDALQNVTKCDSHECNDIAEAEAEAEVQNPLTPLQGEVKAKAKRTRRTKGEIALDYPADVHEVVSHCKQVWRKAQPDNSPINPDWCMLRDRVKSALTLSPQITSKVLCAAIDIYIGQDKKAYKAPQFFFSQGKDGEEGPWVAYARHAYSKLVHGND